MDTDHTYESVHVLERLVVGTLIVGARVSATRILLDTTSNHAVQRKKVQHCP